MSDTSGHTRRLTLPRSARLRSRRSFARVFQRRLRAADQRITLCAAMSDMKTTRLGISVGRRFGNAVRRNRVKRLIREAFRQVRHDLPAGIDWVVIPRPGLESSVKDLQESLESLARRLEPAVRFKQRNGPDGVS